jgi:serine/threonine protein kinase
VRLDEFLLDKYFRISSRLTHPEIADKREFIRLGARALREFHSKKIYHKDLSPKNLLVNTMPNGKLRFYCVDSDSVQFPLRLSLRRRIKNLAQLNGVPTCITTTDKIRFYKEYFGLLELTPKHRLFVNLIFFISRRRSMRSREADRKIRERAISGAETHEDIASL